ncbi:MAG: respiratory nitrate reductase subunit gamma [Pelagibacteraceae bacterium]|nr:respiratory nitrate reductase subunit gamma [Pelagibacteraceae bacterium]
MSAISAAPSYNKLHIMYCIFIFCLLPFTKLVHLPVIPLGTSIDPYVSMRTKKDKEAEQAMRRKSTRTNIQH